MTAVESGILTINRYCWTISHTEYGGHGGMIGDVTDAIAMARAQWRELHDGTNPSTDDWLRVYAMDDQIMFWFDHESAR